MDKTPVRVTQTTRTIRFEMYGPPGEGVDRKHWGFLYTRFLADFTRIKGREPQYDNDWWIEPTDEGIAICYVDDQKIEG